uniref:Rho GTPase-activating protein 20 n=1 Tax=Schistosoma haematobium TaxID=6185 RepID=A0A095A594_SCHHA
MALDTSDLLVYIAREGVAVTDLFRRPGNQQDMKKIISDLEAGRPIRWTDYNFYTLANIAKRYLLHIEGGILGPESEEKLLSTLDIPDDQARIEAMHCVIVSQPKPVQQLLALLFGIWFRMIYHTEVNAMSVEAVAKSVAGYFQETPFVHGLAPVHSFLLLAWIDCSDILLYHVVDDTEEKLFCIVSLMITIGYLLTEDLLRNSRFQNYCLISWKDGSVNRRRGGREKSVRLFVRMLLEEGRKHGFHLIKDAVSREVFERSACNNISTPNNTVNSGSNEVTSRPDDNLLVGNIPSNVSYMQNISSTQSESYISGDGTILYTEASSTVTPTLLRRENRLFEIDTGGFDILNAPIQQTSEKRTCVTTTPIGKTSHHTTPVVNLDSLNAHEFLNPITTVVNPDNSSKNKFPSVVPSISSVENREYNAKLKNTTYRTPSSQSVCFNSVKRRQLERLQKRSDWFLSPPAGLRSSTGLMHLNPNTPGAVHGSIPQIQNKLNTSQTNNNKTNFRNYPIVSTEPHSSSDLDSSSLMDIDLSEDATTTNDYIQNLSQFNINGNDVDVNDIRHLVFTAPERIWNCSSNSSSSGDPNNLLSTTTTGRKRHSHTLSTPEHTMPLTTGSSPNCPLPPLSTSRTPTNYFKDYPVKRSSFQPAVVEEKENYPEV